MLAAISTSGWVKGFSLKPAKDMTRSVWNQSGLMVAASSGLETPLLPVICGTDFSPFRVNIYRIQYLWRWT
jgi:hypothetical protein